MTLKPKGQASTKEEWTASLLAEGDGPGVPEAFPRSVPHSGRVFFNLPNLISKRFCSPANTPPGTLGEYTLLLAALSCLHFPPGVQVKPKFPVLAHSPVHRRAVLRPCWEPEVVLF